MAALEASLAAVKAGKGGPEKDGAGKGGPDKDGADEEPAGKSKKK
jgi:hypothetical protein